MLSKGGESSIFLVMFNKKNKLPKTKTKVKKKEVKTTNKHKKQ